ncbi:TAXI family TRAP transporter solute-binding subunit [Paracraurococcus ruber]|uniref:C4-dicarboxylate ABC transporter substrate-binding protein n=1 Tax=Paracraurococcus ruber TaxID=77675 RepID=A0ABS1CTM4_9PROT|nr:TAXI family TRAP transporter solute-binding subunit [Paracraurococcus ruber]MBK1657703.1 hypothetical protein [Paracraurococcus ruber]TDG31556.1 hypothetical protein E2C05_10570 [Paracraurococcus ruber]
MRLRVNPLLLGWGLGILGLVALAGLWVLLVPPGPKELRIAAGQRGGAYAATAEAYAAALRAQGLEATVVHTDGAVDNLALLRARRVDLALVQGGLAGTAAPAEARERDEGLVSLGSVFFEPAWFFVQAGMPAVTRQALLGRRIAVGPEGSGSRALALALLDANGIPADQVTLLSFVGMRAATALLDGEADAAFFVSAQAHAPIAALMRVPDRARLVDFAPWADAYARLLPYLTPVTLPRSGFSLAEDLPEADVRLLAPAAYVAARADINPQVAALVAGVMRRTHADRQGFAAEGRFPAILNQELPVQPDARRFIERGPPLLQSWLPFHWAVFIDRLLVLAVPALTVALPLLRFAPPLWRWSVERRIWRRYADLARLEGRVADPDAPLDDAARQEVLARLARLEARVATMTVPHAFLHRIFTLRRDIAFLRRQLARQA